MRILTFFLPLLLMPLMGFVVRPAEEGIKWESWNSGYPKATKEKKIVLVDAYTAWCGWCKKLQADVFSKTEFIEWAKKNVVLLELDFPRGKTLSPELQQQNNSLQQTFQVRGYPTIWIFNLNKTADGQKFDIDSYGSLGYPQNAEPGNEQVKFLQDAKSIFENKNSK